jgi:hypothetical protein
VVCWTMFTTVSARPWPRNGAVVLALPASVLDTPASVFGRQADIDDEPFPRGYCSQHHARVKEGVRAILGVQLDHLQAVAQPDARIFGDPMKLVFRPDSANSVVS